MLVPGSQSSQPVAYQGRAHLGPLLVGFGARQIPPVPFSHWGIPDNGRSSTFHAASVGIHVPGLAAASHRVKLDVCSGKRLHELLRLNFEHKTGGTAWQVDVK